MLYKIPGDLVDMTLRGIFDHVVHGCNCFHSMTGGIARQFATAIPELEAADNSTSYGDRAKLGTYSSCSFDVMRSEYIKVCDGVPHIETLPNRSKHRVTVYNLYTQFRPGPDFNHKAIMAGLIRLSDKIPPGETIALPKIGCGIAGGSWAVVDRTLSVIFSHRDAFLIEYLG